MIPASPTRGAPDAAIGLALAEAIALCGRIERGHGRGTVAARFEQLKAAAGAPVAIAVALSDAALARASALYAELQGAEQHAAGDGGGARWTPAGLLATPIASDEFRSDWLAAAIAEGAAIALVIGGEGEVPEGRARDVLRDLAGIVPAIQPVMVPAEGARKPARSWWDDAVLARAPLRLAPIPIATAPGTPMLAAVRAHPRAKSVAAVATLRAMQAAIEALDGVLGRESARQKSLKAREDRFLRAMESRLTMNSERMAGDRVRQRLDDGMARVERQVEEQNRRALLPGAPVNQAVSDLLRSLSPAELEETENYAEIKVTVRSEFAGRLLEAAKKEIRSQFKEDVQQIKAGAETCRAALASDLGQVTGAAPALAPVNVDENEIWRSLRQALALELGYHGTLPKRGVWKRLAEGKQLMFTMLSMLSLAGMVFGFSRADIGPLIALGLPLVFAVGIGLTFLNWKKEDAARLERELDRIREQVSTEVKRLIGEIQREKMMRLKEAMDAIRKDLARRADAALKEYQAASAERTARARNEARDRQRALDTRLRELQAFGPQVARLRQTCGDALREAEQALRTQPAMGASA